MRALLVGNPNCGKSSLFNLLTGDQQTIGNYSGVTIEQKKGYLFTKNTYELIDLPGLYSLCTFTEEESITKQYLFDESYDVIINVIDATCIRRSLFLTFQLKKLDKPMIILLNMWDEIKQSDSIIDVLAIQAALQVKIIPFSVKKKIGLQPLKDTLTKQRPHHKKAHSFEEDTLEEIQKSYQRIDCLLNKTVTLKSNHPLTDQLDRIFLHPFFSIFFFLIFLFIIYYLSIEVFGNSVGKLMDQGINALLYWLKNQCVHLDISAPISSLLCDGIFAGIGAVLKFIPQLMALFFLIGFLEGSGYLARVAMIFDKIFQKIGLSGKSIIPFILGSGCSIPAMMSCRGLEEKRNKQMTLFLVPFVPCSAKLPLMVLFSSFFFKEKAALVCISLYLLAIFIILFVSLLFKKIIPVQKDETLFFDLPAYRFPSFSYLWKDTMEKIFSFIKKAGTLIFLSSLILWFLLSFDKKLQYGCSIDSSLLAFLGKRIDWLFYPFLGERSWPATISALQGLLAREQIVSSMSIIAALDQHESQVFASTYFSFFTPVRAYAYMVFCLFSAPCISAISTMKKELHSVKHTLIALSIQTAIAYLLATLFYQLASWINLFFFIVGQ